MDLFAERLDALGPDFSRWPAAEGAAARALTLRSEEARRLHDEARRMHALVGEAAAADMPNGLAFRIVAEVASRRSDKLGWLFASPRRFGFAGLGFCVAALAIGVALGSIGQPAQADDGGDFDFGSAFSLTLTDGDL
ncbi:hypothetical protein K6K41_22485 [Chenggangzhangella methanolivorans]|uniref:Uncharacterized protein n=2 Tax=Chenggangzhangella methanolivorans TaxID=1437009 RepID=A0A9E6UPK6_9HYPH|nr:hypothetical protein K6K41_22485 [Chenggangzhangella methanolivorans]